jgi:hypothetical protein
VGELNESVEVVDGVVAVALSNNGGSDMSLRRGPDVCCSHRGHARRDADVSPADIDERERLTLPMRQPLTPRKPRNNLFSSICRSDVISNIF